MKSVCILSFRIDSIKNDFIEWFCKRQKYKVVKGFCGNNVFQQVIIKWLRIE